MARPRSLSRSTTVAASGTGKPGKKSKRKSKFKTEKGEAGAKTWDYDDSESDEATAKENTDGEGGFSTVTSKKGGVNEANAADRASKVRTRVEDTRELELTTSSSLKRPRPTKDEATSLGELGHVDNGDALDDGGTREQDSYGEEEEDERSSAGEEEGEAEEGVTLTKEADRAKGGGMGEVMARILEQNVDSRTQAPVLAKRKTKTMKEMEEASVRSAEARSKSAARRAKMAQQFVVPDHTTADYERQLKKIATRGVVALFNAISKRQREATAGERGEEGSKGSSGGTKKGGAVKGASKHAFLDMLKSGVKPRDGAAGAERGAPGGSRGVGGKGGVGAFGDDQAEEASGDKSWTVFKDDYMLGSNNMKDWDKQSEESEPDELERSAMSGDDSE